MLQRLIQRDRILLELLKGSELTNAQLDTLLCELEGMKRREKLKERIRRRDKASITAGSYLRTKRQAHTQANKALKTVILLTYLGIIPQENLPTLLRVADLLCRIKGAELRAEEGPRVLTLIEETLNRMLVTSQ